MEKTDYFKSNETAARLRVAMKKDGIDSEELANRTSIDSFKVAAYVDGAIAMTPTDAVALANALDVSVEWLMGKDSKMSLKVALHEGEKEFSKGQWKAILGYAEIIQREYEKK